MLLLLFGLLGFALRLGLVLLVVGVYFVVDGLGFDVVLFVFLVFYGRERGQARKGKKKKVCVGGRLLRCLVFFFLVLFGLLCCKRNAFFFSPFFNFLLSPEGRALLL